MAETQKIVILNFGGQYTQLIARRVRECHVYSCVLPYDASLETIRAQNPVGVILSGGPASVLEQDAPRCDEGVYQLGVPVLGIAALGLILVLTKFDFNLNSLKASAAAKKEVAQDDDF